MLVFNVFDYINLLFPFNSFQSPPLHPPPNFMLSFYSIPSQTCPVLMYMGIGPSSGDGYHFPEENRLSLPQQPLIVKNSSAMGEIL